MPKCFAISVILYLICELFNPFASSGIAIFSATVIVSIKARVSTADTLTNTEYDDLVSAFGKTAVDNQIKHITDHGYKSRLNYETIKLWCTERASIPPVTQTSSPKDSIFCSFTQRSDYTPDELECLLVYN